MHIKGLQKSLLTFTVISVIVFSIFTLLHDNRAFAVSAVDFTLDTANNEVFYQSSIDTYVILGIADNTNNATITFMSATTSNTTDRTTVNIFAQKDGCNISTDPIQNNPCSSSNGSAWCETDGLETLPCSNNTSAVGDFEGLWCGKTYCFVLFEADSGASHQLIRFWSLGESSSMSGDISGYLNITTANDILPDLWGYDECDNPPNCGLGGITVYYVSEDSGENTGNIRGIGGTALMGQVFTYDLIMFTENRVVDIEGCRHCGGQEGVTRIAVSSASNSGASRNFVMTDAQGSITYSGGTTSLNTACSGSSVLADTSNTGSLEYLGDTENRLMMLTNTGYFTLQVVSPFDVDCHLYGSEIIDSPRSIAIDEEHNYLYIAHGSGATLQSLTRYNLTMPAHGTALETIDFTGLEEPTITGWVSSGQPYDSMAMSPNADTLLMLDDTARARLLYLETFTGEDGTGGFTGEEICFVAQATGQSICYPTDENGNPIVQSLVEPASSQHPIYAVVGGYACQIGFYDNCTSGQPTNTDLETNGIGYLMWFGTWAIMMAVMGVAFFGTIKKAPVIGLIPMMVVLFIATALGVVLNWIPERDFYIVVFIVIGFASLAGTKFVLGQIGGRGGGED